MSVQFLNFLKLMMWLFLSLLYIRFMALRFKMVATNNNLIYNKDFFCGYSPERINPGDKSNIQKLKKLPQALILKHQTW